MTTKTTTTTRTNRPTTTYAAYVDTLIATNNDHAQAAETFQSAKEALETAHKARVEANVQVARILHEARQTGQLRASAGRDKFAQWLTDQTGVQVSAEAVRNVVRAVKADAGKYSGVPGSAVSGPVFSHMSGVVQGRALQTDSGKKRRGSRTVSFGSLAKQVDRVAADLDHVERGADGRGELVEAVERLARQLSA